MDGVVIHMSANGAGAIIWCEDQGPLGLVRREDLLAGIDKPLAVGDMVRFDILEEGDLRICAGVTRNAGFTMPELPSLLRRDDESRRRRAKLTLVPPVEPASRGHVDAMVCV